MEISSNSMAVIVSIIRNIKRAKYSIFPVFFVAISYLQSCSSGQDGASEADNERRAQSDSSVMFEFDRKTDSELLLDGFFKVSSNDTLSTLLRSKQFASSVVFSVYDSSLAAEYEHRMHIQLDSLDRFMMALGNHRPQIVISHDQQDKSFGLTKEIFSLFPKPWFSTFTSDTARVKNELTLTTLRLGQRGHYCKIQLRNNVLPVAFNASEYVNSVFSSSERLDLRVWCPPQGQVLTFDDKEIITLVHNTFKKQHLNQLMQYQLFADTATLICLSFNRNLTANDEKTADRPALELFFSLKDANPLVIVSNGYGYAAYRVDNMLALKEHLRKYID